MQRATLCLLLVATLAVTGCRGCGGARGGLQPPQPEMVKEPDGANRYRVAKGPFKAYYDQWGRLERIERDSNSDGKTDQISHHAGRKDPELVVLDTDFDGHYDRWEYYAPDGKLLKIGAARQGSAPDMWIFTNAQGQVVRREYDDDRDGKVDRAEELENGRITWTQVDADRDGRMDRWQLWAQGRLAAEDLDTDGDGKPDRRILYGSDGRVRGFERVLAK
jgi:hypothetical protein